MGSMADNKSSENKEIKQPDLDKRIEDEIEELGKNNRIVRGKDGPVSSFLGALGGLDTKIALLSRKAGTPGPSEKTLEYVKNAFKDDGMDNVTVRAGHTRPWEDTKRLFTDPKLKDISLIGRMLAIPSTLIGGYFSKWDRSDHYNPFTKTMSLYSDIPSVALHEMGHAKDFLQHRYPTLYSYLTKIPPLFLYPEYKASKYAHQWLPEKLKYQTGRFLFPAFGSYLAYAAGMDPILGMGAGYVAGQVFNWFRNLFSPSHKEQKKDEKVQKLPVQGPNERYIPETKTA